MMPRHTDGMFHFTYEKTSGEILEKVQTKKRGLADKIEERTRRILELRREHEIDDQALIQLLTAARKSEKDRQYAATFNYSNASQGGRPGDKGMVERTIGAGVVNHLLTESDNIEADRSTLDRLGLISRNLRPVSGEGGKGERDAFMLSYEELEYLGF